MKRILILSALCALFLLPSFAAVATPVCTSPAGISVSGNDPIDQILAVLKEVVDIKKEATATKGETKGGINKKAVNDASKVLVVLEKLDAIDKEYGELSVDDRDRTAITDFIVQNHSVLYGKPATNESAKAVFKKLQGYKTISQLLTGIIRDL